MKSCKINYKGYNASIRFDEADNIFIGEVLGITDSLNFHGQTITELEASFHNCIDSYLEICNQIGKDQQ